MGNYIPVTDDDREQMLKVIGISSPEELFRDVPEELKIKGELDLPEGCSEMEAERSVRAMASKNTVYDEIFRGAGAYRHYIPAVVDETAAKENLRTAYTPYQAEISQGVLQSIYEYQSYICMLTGMEVSNAGVYDGAQAAAEAAHMCAGRGRNKVLISAAANPYVISVVKTYAFGYGMDIVIIPEKDYRTDQAALKDMLDASVAGVYVQQPNFYGSIEDAQEIGELVHAAGAKYILGVNPIAAAIMKTAVGYGADIAVGEGQPLGMPLSFGGPYLGFMAVMKKDMRSLPGRIVGETVDTEGRRGYVLTLQAREQHIRREKASSNICSNEALCALRAGCYLSAMGPDGLRNAAIQSMSKAHYLRDRLSEIGFAPADQGETFHEFVSAAPAPAEEFLSELEKHGMLGGLPLKDAHEGELLWCCTEMNSKEAVDSLVAILKGVH